MAAIVTLDQQTRNGTYSSSSIAIPTGINPDTGNPYTFIILNSTMSSDDAAKNLTSTVTIYVSYDGVTYVTGTGFSYRWTGGIADRHGNYTGPNITISIPQDSAGNFPVRVFGSIDTEGNTLNTGLTLEIK